MLTSYEEFKDYLTGIIKIRSKNFVNTDCDLAFITGLVYTDLTSSVILSWVKQEYLCTDSETMVLDRDNHSIITQKTTEEYGIAFDIVDAEDYSVNEWIAHVDECTYKWKTPELVSDYNGKKIYFVRPVKYSLEELPTRFYSVILPAIIEGIMYNIETSIPSEIDGQLSNLYYQRFYQEKKTLINRYPQVQYVDKNLPLRTEDGRYSL